MVMNILVRNRYDCELRKILQHIISTITISASARKKDMRQKLKVMDMTDQSSKRQLYSTLY